MTPARASIGSFVLRSSRRGRQPDVHGAPVLESVVRLGAICVYVLLGIAFAGVFAAVDDFNHGTFFAQTNYPASNVEFLYFSFITMTTVGYGDLSPATDPGRVLVTFEALLGQVFLVTLVARLVSMYGVQRSTSIGAPAETSIGPPDEDTGEPAGSGVEQ